MEQGEEDHQDESMPMQCCLPRSVLETEIKTKEGIKGTYFQSMPEGCISN